MKYVFLYRIARKTHDIYGTVSVFKEIVDADDIFNRMQEVIDEHNKNTYNGTFGGLPKKAQFFPIKRYEPSYCI